MINNYAMPNVGDIMMRKMHVPSFGLSEVGAEQCVVIFVNHGKYYYTVRFLDSGILESFKVPHLDQVSDFRQAYKKLFGKYPIGICVFEQGIVFASVEECAEYLNVSPMQIKKCLNGFNTHINGYHIYEFK